MIHQADRAEEKILVQTNKELNKNIKVKKRFSDFLWRESAFPKRKAFDSIATHRDQHQTHYSPHSSKPIYRNTKSTEYGEILLAYSPTNDDLGVTTVGQLIRILLAMLPTDAKKINSMNKISAKFENSRYFLIKPRTVDKILLVIWKETLFNKLKPDLTI